MQRITYREFCDEFYKANEENRISYGVIVFSQKNWKKDYPEESRSYATFSDQWGWDYSKMGHCRMGYCLDGSEGVRLDYYDWKVEYCYFITEEEFEKISDKCRCW